MTTNEAQVPAFQASITDATGAPVTDEVLALEILRDATNNPEATIEAEDISRGVWLVSLSESDATELEEDGYIGRVGAYGIVDIEWI